MNKKKYFQIDWLLCVLLLVLFIIFSGCRNNGIENLDTPETGVVEREIIWNWFNLAIGESQKDDLLLELGVPKNRHDLIFREQIIGESYVYQITDFPSQLSGSNYIYFYIVDDVVEALEFDSTGIPYGRDIVSLDDLVDEFGQPDIVSYHKIYPLVRLVVWLDEGVQANVSFIPGTSENLWLFTLDNTKISEITYFYPLSKDRYFQNFLSQWYSDEAPKGDVIDGYPVDPFLWE